MAAVNRADAGVRTGIPFDRDEGREPRLEIESNRVPDTAPSAHNLWRLPKSDASLQFESRSGPPPVRRRVWQNADFDLTASAPSGQYSDSTRGYPFFNSASSHFKGSVFYPR